MTLFKYSNNPVLSIYNSLFLSFAKLVISSRIKNYLKGENKHQHSSFEDMVEKGLEIKDEYLEEQEDSGLLTEEIEKTSKEAYKALSLNGVARIDYIYDNKKKKLYNS